MYTSSLYFYFFFFNDTATTEIYTLSLHDALPISGIELRKLAGGVHIRAREATVQAPDRLPLGAEQLLGEAEDLDARSEEHTSELQSQSNLVCRLLLEKKKQKKKAKNKVTQRIIIY